MREDAVLQTGEEDNGVFQTLRGVQRHERDDAVGLAIGVGDLVGVGNKRHLLHELPDPTVGDPLAEFPCHTDELSEVLHPALVLRVGRGSQLGQQAGAVEDGLKHLRRRHVAGDQLAQLVHQVSELPDRLGRPGRHAADLVAAAQRLGEGHPLARGESLQAGLGPVADPPPRGVEDAPQRHRVGRVGQHPQVGKGVADLLAFVEAHPTDHLVGQPDADEHLFEDPTLRIGPIEHRHLPGLDPVVVAELVDLAGHESRLVVLVVGDVADDLLAVAGVGPQPLVGAAGVLGDDGVRG